MWYTGTATFTAGSLEVVGDGNVDFVSNVFPGDACIGPNGLPMEIDRADSRNKLILRTPYNGQGGTGQFRVQPTQDFIRSLAYAAVDFKNTYGGYRDTVLQGIFQPGTAAAPGVRGVADQDTGLRWVSDNVLALVSGGVDALTVNGTNIGVGVMPLDRAHVKGVLRLEDPTDSTVRDVQLKVNAGGDLQLVDSFDGTVRMTVTWNGLVGIGTSSPARKLHVQGGAILNSTSAGPAFMYGGNNDGAGNLKFSYLGMASGTMSFGRVTDDLSTLTEYARFDQGGNFLVGATSSAYGGHILSKNVIPNQAITTFYSLSTGQRSVQIQSVDGEVFSGAGAAMFVGRNNGTGRSINAGGTGNFGGSDYAEYMVKAVACGIIAKGDVCGVDRDGRLTQSWADAVSFVVKSTEPSLVGGDTWAAHLPPKPELPGAEPMPPVQPGAAPVAPIEPGPEPTEEGAVYVAWLQARFAFAVAERDYALALAEWQSATDAYPAARAAFEADHAAWVDAKAAYARDLPAWEAQLEAARVCVDRIAFCGQVPCNVSGDFEVGDYIVAAASGAGIKAVAMKLEDMTIAQYARRIGKVWAIRDGRAWIDVQHG